MQSPIRAIPSNELEEPGMSEEKEYRIGGYVKRAKLNLRNGEDVKAFHRGIYERRFGDFEDGTLVDPQSDE